MLTINKTCYYSICDLLWQIADCHDTQFATDDDRAVLDFRCCLHSVLVDEDPLWCIRTKDSRIKAGYDWYCKMFPQWLHVFDLVRNVVTRKWDIETVEWMRCRTFSHTLEDWTITAAEATLYAEILQEASQEANAWLSS